MADELMTMSELVRARRAARLAQLRFAGPVGELLACELRAHADFGHRFGPDTVLTRLVEELLDGESVPENRVLELLCPPG